MESKSKVAVLHYVWIDNIHVNSLVSAVSKSGLRVKKSKARISKVGLIILLSPIYPLIHRVAGYRILHIHWMLGVFRPPSPSGRYADKFFYLWYKLFMSVTRLVNLKVVWTAHNFMPMGHVFEDNLAARKHLVQHCSAVIALSESVATRLTNELGAKNVVIIPAAEPTLVPTESRITTRENLHIGENQKLFSAIGHMKPYKGPDIFLQSILLQDSNNRFLLSGAIDDSEFVSQVIELTETVKARGHSLETNFSFLPDSELANLLQASDFLVCPFRDISNSGFINLALAAGTPLILPDWESLAWVPREAALWYPADGGAQALASAIQYAGSLNSTECELMSQAARDFMKTRGWDNYVLQHSLLYEALMSN
ncbi:MAG: glycosyltransferase family 4 protein [Actinomycetes bacterium]